MGLLIRVTSTFSPGTKSPRTTSHNEVPASQNLRHWNEFDVNPEIDITFLKNFDLGVYSLNFLSPNNEFASISEVEFQLTYDDTSLPGLFALHPSFVYQKELVGISAIESRGSLFEFNLTPGIKLIKDGMFPTKVDFPLSVGLGDDWFYGGPTFGYDYSDRRSEIHPEEI